MDGLPVVFVRAKKEVYSGDEVTYDYGSFMITSNMNIQKCLRSEEHTSELQSR